MARKAADPELLARQREWADDGETDAAPFLDAGTHPADGPSLFLVVRSGDALRLLDLHDPGAWIVGRGADAQIVVEDRRVSRHHAKVTLSGGVLAIEDLGSRNGTLVNGKVLRGATARIGTGDVVEVGNCPIVVATRAARTDAAALAAGDVDVVVADPEMARVYASVRKVARMPTTVLVLGETGTGKDVLAQRLHAWSARASRPFVRVSCAGIPDTLLESELFGHERGAFTGADRRKAGYFEAGDGGTVFLDEIGELSASAQVKLLHVLENRAVVRLGGTTPVPLDVRIVCATHRDLQALVAEERFRADLYYRISPFIVRIPPLRERRVEIPLLAEVFAQRLAAQVGGPAPTVAPDAIAILLGHGWPGNVRELRNAIEHAFVMAEGATLHAAHFAAELRALSTTTKAAPDGMRKSLRNAERKSIEAALVAEGGNQTRAATRLGIPRRTLVHKLARYRREDSGGEGD